MRSRRSVRIGGLNFQGWPADHQGDWFVLDPAGIQNILGGVDVRREDVARPFAHGSFQMPGTLAARVMPLSGHMSARTPVALDYMQRQLSGLLAGGSTARLTVETDSEMRWCDVGLGAATQIEQLDATTARFLVTFWAADPRMYGEARTFPAGQPAYHYGNFDATPRLLVGAGSGGYTVTGPGGRQVVVSSAPSGAHYIDFSDGGLFTNAGVRQVGAISIYQPWTVSPGAQVSVSITGSRSLSQRVTDTFV